MVTSISDASPLAPGRSPVRIYYRDLGHGAVILFLHGGWGYGIYPFDHQALALEGQRRIVIPDRTGYGGSGTLDVHASISINAPPRKRWRRLPRSASIASRCGAIATARSSR